jgi:DNA-binding transcriptional MocR family regulator
MPSGIEKPLINLLRGWPAPGSLPAEQLRAASVKALSDPSVFIPGLQYGPDLGYQPLREQLARYLSSVYSSTGDADRICITGGASQSIACILQSFTDPSFTQTVWAIAPCYYLACPIFEDAGFRGRLRAIPEDAEGIDLKWLERGLKAGEPSHPKDPPAFKTPSPHRKVYRHIIYCVPTCSNPSGKSMSESRRCGLVALARKHDALIISDDVYDLLQWPIKARSQSFTSGSLPPLLPIRPLPRLVDIDLSLGPSEFDAQHPAGLHFGRKSPSSNFLRPIMPHLLVYTGPKFDFWH